MIFQRIGKLFNGTYNNVIEASYSSFLIRRLFGTAVMVTTLQSGNIVGRRFCPKGFLLFFFWNSVYLFCTYKVFAEDQTIVKHLLNNTKLRRYGADFVRISGFIFGLFAMAVIPFTLSGNTLFFQKVFDIDNVLKDSGEINDFNKIPIRSHFAFIAHISMYIIGLTFHWCLVGTSISAKIFTTIYIDTQAFLISMTFMHYVLLIRDRFVLIKQALIRIREENYWKCNVFRRIEVPKDLTKVLQLSDKQICEKIRSCAKIYTMLCKSCCLLMEIVGLPIHVCFLVYKLYLIISIFYLLEATQLSYDLIRCIEFIMVCLWGIAFCICIIFLAIYFSEITMKEVS